MTPSNAADFFLKNVLVGSSGLIEAAESHPAVSLKPRNPNFANNYLEYLGEFEAMCETALARESGP
jgi:hypothetical protein